MAQLKLYHVLFLVLVYFISICKCNTSNETCQKDLTKLKSENRSCADSCTTSQCKNARAKCVCDGPCGLVCVPTNLRCSSALKIPEHGTVRMPRGNRFNQMIFYICEDGFELIGKTTRICQSNGKWSGSEPFCTPIGVRCAQPKFELGNAYVTDSNIKDEYYLGDEITLECKLGYTTTGNDILTTHCEWSNPEDYSLLGEGTAYWTPIATNCTAIVCKKPESLQNGFYVGKNFIFGSEIKYYCNTGYYLVGTNSSFCSIEGIWSNEPPTCEIVTCTKTDKLKNGKVLNLYEDKPLTYLSVINYTCDDGFGLQGLSSRQCNELGKLTGDEPKCLAIDCGQPKSPENGYIKYLEGTKEEQQVVYICNEYTTMKGESTATCKYENQLVYWSSEPPICIQNCQVPDIVNVNFWYRNRKVNVGLYIPSEESITMHCSSGYEITNDLSNFEFIRSTCVNSKWSELIECEPARCFKTDLNMKYLHDRNWSNAKIPVNLDNGNEVILECYSNHSQVKSDGILKCVYGEWKLPESEAKCRKGEPKDENESEEVIAETDLATTPRQREFYRNTCVYEHKDKNLLAYSNEKLLDAQSATKISLGETIIFRCYDISEFLLEGSKIVKCVYYNRWKGNIPTCKKLHLRSTDNAPVVSYSVPSDMISVSNSGTLQLLEDSELILKCWWFRKNRTPQWKWNDQEIDFDDVKQDWNNAEEYYELFIKNVKIKHSGYFSCTTSNRKTHGIRIKVQETKTTPTVTIIPLTSTTSTVTIKTTTAENNPTLANVTLHQVSSQNLKCRLQSSDEMDLFVNGEEVGRNQEYFEHGSRLIFRCTRPNSKLIGAVTTACNNGQWIPTWPYCYKIDRYDSPYPGVSLLTSAQWERLDNGDYWISTRNADLYFRCLYGSQHEKPEMTLNWRNIENVARAYYNEHEKAWLVKPSIDSHITKMTFRCKIPDRLDNEITAHFGDKCTLNEKDIKTMFDADVLPFTRRFPFYVHGDTVYLKCAATTRRKLIPFSISCRNGYWVKTDKRDRHCY